MTPQDKLRTANVLMLAGMGALILGIVLVILTASASQASGDGALGLAAVMFVAYAFALIVSVPGALWSAVLVLRHPELDTRTGKRNIIVVCIALLPVVLYLGQWG